MKKQKYQSDWEEFAQLDMKWAILTDPNKKYNRWEDNEFFDTGHEEIEDLLIKIKGLDIEIKFTEALDFGCGIGRLTKALAKHFSSVYGIDISWEMISYAKELHKKNKNMIFIQNTRDDLSCFKSNTFDLIYSVITLQHISDQDIIINYLEEFIRILNPGGVLFFQLPTVPGYTWYKSILLKARRYLYYLLINIGFPKEFCFSQLRLAPYMYMNYIPSNEIKMIFSGKATRFEIYNDKSTNTKYLFQKKTELKKS